MSEKPVILISGASSGIGAATALLFSQNGYRVVLAARRLERLKKLADQITLKGGISLIVPTDVSRPTDCTALIHTTIENFGRIDVLFNNAGFGKLKWLEELDPLQEIEAQLDVNLLGVIRVTQAALPHMIEKRKGHIINMGSIASFIATPTYSVYAASKFGVRGFTEALRREVNVFGIRVSLVCPGGVDTEFGQIAGFMRTTRVTTPRWLVLRAEEVAQAVWKLTQNYRRVVVLPSIMHIAIWLNALVPGFLDMAIEHLFVRKERLLTKTN